MATFDGRLIDPSEEQLAGVLGKAMKCANRENRYQSNKMTRDAEFWLRFARDVLRTEPEGRRRSCKGGYAVPEVIAGWWTDPAGRKHVRVIGRTRPSRGYHYGLRRESDLRALPPWWQVYPETVLGVRGKKEGERFLAACRCGAVGTPESLGWMGDTCGPCFDRRAEGGVPSGGFGQFGNWASQNAHFCFTADGRHLVGQNHSGAFWKVSREDGNAAVGRRKATYNRIVASATAAGGVTLVMRDGGVYRWRDDSEDTEQVVSGRRSFWGRVALSPDASRVVLIGYQHSYAANLTEVKPSYGTLDTPEGFYGLQFAPDGSHLVGTTFTGELRRVDAATLAASTIRRDAFDGQTTGYGPPSDLAISPDGSAALVRRDRHYPRRSKVRHVPLPTGKVVELNVPEWHHPSALAYSRDGRVAVTAEAQGGWVGFFDVGSGKSLGFVRAVTEDSSWQGGQIEFSADGSALAVSYNAGRYDHGATVAVWPWPDVLQAAGMG